MKDMDTKIKLKVRQTNQKKSETTGKTHCISKKSTKNAYKFSYTAIMPHCH